MAKALLLFDKKRFTMVTKGPFFLYLNLKASKIYGFSDVQSPPPRQLALCTWGHMDICSILNESLPSEKGTTKAVRKPLG